MAEVRAFWSDWSTGAKDEVLEEIVTVVVEDGVAFLHSHDYNNQVGDAGQHTTTLDELRALVAERRELIESELESLREVEAALVSAIEFKNVSEERYAP